MAAQDYIHPEATLLLASKGIEKSSGAFLTDNIRKLFPNAKLGLLSGPSFASDVARGLPTAITLAAGDQHYGATLAELISSPVFRPYLCTDMRGVEIGGALKNVFAIAAGIVVGKGFGESARAAVIARSFSEMQRFGVAFGAKAATFGGLSGLGDLVLTCTSEQSRNLRFGLSLGRGESVKNAKEKSAPLRRSHG